MMDLSTDDIRDRIARSYLKGDGQGVREVWKLIAHGELADEQMISWTKFLASWIDGKNYENSHRLERLHTGLVVTGNVEPKLDTLSDEHLLLLCATAGIRAAAEEVWRLIARGQATQGLREQWLDHVADGISEFLSLERSKRDSNRRGEKLLKPLGLAGKSKGLPENSLIECIVNVICLFPKEHYAKNPHDYITLVIKKLFDIGAISTDRHNDDNLARTIREMVRAKRELSSSKQILPRAEDNPDQQTFRRS